MKTLVSLNGKISPPEEALVSVLDRGFLFGDGVYEAGRSYNGCFLYLEEHWKRFRNSAAKLILPFPWTNEQLTRGLHELAKTAGEKEVCFRSIITRGMVPTLGLDVEPTTGPNLVHILYPLPTQMDEKRKKGVHLLTSHIQRNSVLAQDPNIKTSNYLNSLLAIQDVKKRGGEDAILCDSAGNVTEGTNFAIFGVTCTGKIITPSLEVGILDSITRRHLIALAKADYEVKEGYIRLSEFLDCAEVFMASSTREIMPVRQWDDQTFKLPGPITQDLHRRLRLDIDHYVKSHPHF